ncbi:MAG: DUF3810 domain-containing protein [Oscillospiraceae bacterium]|nr:DUF3810 domain-containing protein [Oscillospiraceae bacterium]
MKLKKTTIVMLCIIGLMLVINLFARLCPPAADFYILHIFPLISGFWSRITGLFPFSVGEWMIVIGVVLLILLVPGYVLLLAIVRKDDRPKAAGIYGHVYGWIFTWLSVIVTLHFTVLYQGTSLSKQLGDVTYEDADVLEVVQKLVDTANEEAKYVARDEDGYFAMTDELMPEAKNCMQRLAVMYPQFRGWYPNAKPIFHSYFFSQQNLLGIYYPHTLEANYNPVVYPVNLPVIICHEYTHLKGNIFEDEAGYYAFLACMTSASHDFRYSGCISALEYLNLDFSDDPAAQAQYKEILEGLDPAVRKDMYTYVPPDYWESHAKEEVIPTQIVKNTADAVVDTSLRVNGVPEGKQSYRGMVALLLHDYLGDENAG